MDKFFSQLALADDTRNRLGRHLLFWVACWFFQGLLYGFIYTDVLWIHILPVSFTESLIFLPQHIFLSYSIIYFVLPNYLFKERYWSGIAWVLLLIMITALFSPLLQKLAIAPFRRWIGFPYQAKNIFFSFLAGLRGSMTVAGFAVAIKILKNWYLKKTENEILEKEKLKAELELLKGQLHPHFMFNTLNSIYALAIRESSRATAEAILKLSNLMHYMVIESKQQLIPLEEEMKTLRAYIEMEKVRFGERLDITVNITGDMTCKAIAPLMLMPFVENSFKHGTSQMQTQAWMSIDIAVKDQELKMKLINGKPDKTSDHNLPSGIGLQNVKKRLSLVYPGSHDLRIMEDETTFIVSLGLQLNKTHRAVNEIEMSVSR